MFVVRNIFSNAAYRARHLRPAGRARPSGCVDPRRGRSARVPGLRRRVRKASPMPPIATRATNRGSMSFSLGPATRLTWADNVASILRPPLPPAIVERLHASFGHLTGVGLGSRASHQEYAFAVRLLVEQPVSLVCLVELPAVREQPSTSTLRSTQNAAHSAWIMVEKVHEAIRVIWRRSRCGLTSIVTSPPSPTNTWYPRPWCCGWH